MQRLANEVVKLKGELTVARQDAMLAKQAQTEAERELQDTTAATTSMHQQLQQQQQPIITEAPEQEEGSDGLRQPLLNSSAAGSEASDKQRGGIPVWMDAIVGFFCNRGQEDAEHEEQKQQGRAADQSGSSS